ncbi:MAG: hypothetical protein ACREMP_08775 [Candidatus Tyrphobacter sp.]
MIAASGDLTMMRDVEARFALRGRRLRYTVLTPFGSRIGRGALRVLRVTESMNAESGDVVDVVLGYEAYR